MLSNSLSCQFDVVTGIAYIYELAGFLSVVTHGIHKSSSAVLLHCTYVHHNDWQRSKNSCPHSTAQALAHSIRGASEEASGNGRLLTVISHVQLHGYAVPLAIKAVLKREGLRGLYGGFWAVAYSAG